MDQREQLWIQEYPTSESQCVGAGLAPTQYVAAQGTRLGRAGRVFVEQDGNTIWVGGSSVTCMAGEVLL